MATAVVVLLHHDHGGATIKGLHRRRQPRNARSGDHDIRGHAPLLRGTLSLEVCLDQPGQGSRTEAGDRAGLDETSPADRTVGLVLAHVRSPFLM